MRRPSWSGPDIPESGYRVTELGGGAYGITSGLANTMFLVTKKGVVVVDAPPDLGGKLPISIPEVIPKPVTHPDLQPRAYQHEAKKAVNAFAENAT